MNTPAPRSRLGDDTRAVAPVIGFILIVGILFVAFAGYQATTVPQQNQAAEFEHLQDVENDLVDVRRGILRAGQSDVREFATVQLGMSYPTRLIALNPPQPTGTLQTSEPYNITIESQDDPDDRADVATRFLTYEPGYNELPSRPVRYENSVLYREAENNVFIEDQELVTDGGTLEITALQNELREQGTGQITVSLFPTREFTADEIPDGEITVTIPTRLDEDYWDGELEDTDIYVGVDTEDNPYPDDINAIEFELDTEETDLDLNTVGIDSEPEDDETEPLKQGVGGNVNENANGNGQSDRINVVEIGDLRIDGTRDQTITFELLEERLANGETVTIDLSNINSRIKDEGGDGYDGAEVVSPSGPPDNAEAEITDDGDTLIFEAKTGNVDEDTDYSIEIEGIDMPDSDSLKGPELVEFERSDNGSDVGVVEIIDD